ncbi:hypothetical protein [Flavivirga jejuensis]|uniref:Uncharacterized protein n=1 Tax=Flavivirga jejuensis TaxID=870487 RepID=A0ABT8WN09_9FLAO|nr:hypothetical protein [Flavivirga jejuensis]MDO5974513.1 hypothetical protein [Flavivirga jejuensis]
MKNVILILITAIVLPFVSFAQGITGTSYPTNGTTYYGLNSDTTDSYSTHFGSDSGQYSNGEFNVFLGSSAGYYVSGTNNVYSGSEAGFHGYGSYNVYSGSDSGYGADGSNNTYLGSRSGVGSSGSYNVFLGNQAGSTSTESNRLYIDNSGTTTPLIYGKFDTDQVGINTTNIPVGYTFAVLGKIITEEVKVKLYASWPDYIFNKDYNLPSLKEVENHIKENGHLQNIPSAKEVAENGILLGDMNAKLLQKIEELTLYTIQQQKELEEQKEKNSSLEDRLKKLEELVSNK